MGSSDGMKVEDELDRAIERYFDGLHTTTFGNRFTITKFNGEGKPSDTRALAHTWLKSVIQAVSDEMQSSVVETMVPDPDLSWDCKMGRWVSAEEVEGDCGY